MAGIKNAEEGAKCSEMIYFSFHVDDKTFAKTSVVGVSVFHPILLRQERTTTVGGDTLMLY